MGPGMELELRPRMWQIELRRELRLRLDEEEKMGPELALQRDVKNVIACGLGT